MKTKIFLSATLFVAGPIFANAVDINLPVDTMFTPVNTIATQTFNVNGNIKLHFDASGSSDKKNVLCGVNLNGAGKAVNGTKAALQISGGANLTGQLTIGATTNIWSHGAQNNLISGNIKLANSAADAVVNINHSPSQSSRLLKLTGSSIALPTLNVADGASVEFSSQNISFNNITGNGAVTFLEGSLINLGLNDTLTITAKELRFGNTLVSEGASLDSFASYFKGADANSIKYQNGVLTVSSAIPEPSTFGLLAGLGALALVASRRRRRSRKAA